jgi:hypothetical protein
MAIEAGDDHHILMILNRARILLSTKLMRQNCQILTVTFSRTTGAFVDTFHLQLGKPGARKNQI